jgi:hypothetical protein
MNLLKSLTSLFEEARGWFESGKSVSSSELRASGSAMVHLADTLSNHADEWTIGATSVTRKGMEVGWKGSLDAPRGRIFVKMDGSLIHITPPEARILKESVKKLLETRQPK